LLIGSYNPWLVLASLVIAMLASYTALDMAGRVSGARGRSAGWWLAGGSLAMGVGIWSMHFLGMLAFSLPVAMGYDPLITLLSLLIAVASSAFALWMVCLRKLSWPRLCIGAVLMGSGVCSMHYTGMAAMRMHPAIHYNPLLFALSVVIAVVASGAALWIAFQLRQHSKNVRLYRAAAAFIMGLAIAGMHYTGMAAAQFPKNSTCGMSASGLSTGWLALLILVFALAVMSIALITAMLDFRTALLTASLADAHQELRFLALHDSLTKLPNRTLLENRLTEEIENAKRSGQPFSVMYLDLDGFKQINDAFGHHVGDLLLIESARRIRTVVPARDTIARVGGDEFVLLVGAADPADSAGLAQQLISTLLEPYTVAGHTCQVTVSIGIAIYRGKDTTHQELLKNADTAMYHAKGLGRNTYCFFELSMNEDVHEKVQMLHDLRIALERQELILYYQPKFNARTGTMSGVEALIRWQHPTRGLVPPGDFIPLAEKIGLIIPIGDWTISEACRQMSEWRAAGFSGWTVAVNLSPVQFNHPALIETIRRSLEIYGLEPGCLILEITESTAMRDIDAGLAILRQLRQMGVGISIDDFGVGYSSLLYLKQLPAGELKIDRGFVKELTGQPEDAAIISAVVALGRTLNLEIVAEGVETLAQQEFLMQVGCSSLQGFLLGRPMPPEQLIAAIEDGVLNWQSQPADPRSSPKLVAKIPATYDHELGEDDQAFPYSLISPSVYQTQTAVK
jgi:diguanylate cyclase (GGDEF)-like protein